MKNKKIKICDDAIVPPKVAKGWSVWVEWGTFYKARTVNKRKFGGHDYDNGGYARGIRDCRCGCHMADASSSGPVDPFGPCPLNSDPTHSPEFIRGEVQKKVNWKIL